MDRLCRVGILTLLVFLLLCTTVNSDIISDHQKYRAEVQSPTLVWSSTIATSAQTWANYLRDNNKFEHSSSGYGENIAAGYPSWTAVVEGWAAEKADFRWYPFGNSASKTNDWMDIGHYTQIIWRDTTQIGCGDTTHPSWGHVYVCQYNPPGNYMTQYPFTNTIHQTYRVGIYRSTDHTFYLRPFGFPTAKTSTVSWGTGSDIPITGDWNGDATTDYGIYRSSCHTFYLRPWTWPGTPTITIPWGTGSDIPVIGDWNGDGDTEVGIYRPSTHTFYLRPEGWPGTPTIKIPWGTGSDIPVTGDWDGDGDTEVGIYRPSTHTFYLRHSNYPIVPAIKIPWGTGSDIPVTGSWNGDLDTEVGVYRPSTHTFYLRPEGWPGNPTTMIAWGTGTDKPVTGKWI